MAYHDLLTGLPNRVMLQVVGDGSDITVGTDVELVLRKYAHERGVPVYGYKARAAEGTATADAEVTA